MGYQRQPDENIKKYKLRLFQNKDIYDLTCEQIAELINKETGDNFGESVYRKWYKVYFDGLSDGLKEQIQDEDVLKELDHKKQELQKERYKVQTEKIEYNRFLREQSRYELFEEKVAQIIQGLEKPKIPKYTPRQIGNYDGCLYIADSHYGCEFVLKGLMGEIINSYNTDIFEKRMWDLFNQTLDIITKEKLNHINIFNLSDSIDGMLRQSQLMSLQLGSVDSTMEFANFITHWLNKLSEYVTIDYYAVQNSNHNQNRPLNSKRDEFPNENTERIITWFIHNMLKDNPNIEVHLNCVPMWYVNVVGVNILATHGQDDKNLEKSLKDYVMMYGYPIDLLVTAHMHHGFCETIGSGNNGNIEVTRIPSIIGTDLYSASLKKSSKAGTKLMIIEEGKGKTIEYDINLN